MEPRKILSKAVAIDTNVSGNSGTKTISGINGRILGILVECDTGLVSAPIVVTADTGKTLLNLTATATTFYPIREQAIGATGSTIAGVYQPFLNLGGDITVVVTGGTASKTGRCRVLYE